MRIGHGYDVHRLVEGRKCIIGGVEIPFDKGLLGHSDADVLLHAIADAILGAAAAGDIGQRFPDNSNEFKDADSMLILARSFEIINKEGYKIVNIDATVIAEAPKLKPYILDMRENIAKACQCRIEQISVKATTEEGLGFSGKGEGIAAHAVCLID